MLLYIYIIIIIIFFNKKFYIFLEGFFNDPSAGSPTETLLRLLLPLNNQVRSTFAKQRNTQGVTVNASGDLTK